MQLLTTLMTLNHATLIMWILYQEVMLIVSGITIKLITLPLYLN